MELRLPDVMYQYEFELGYLKEMFNIMVISGGLAIAAFFFLDVSIYKLYLALLLTNIFGIIVQAILVERHRTIKFGQYFDTYAILLFLADGRKTIKPDRIVTWATQNQEQLDTQKNMLRVATGVGIITASVVLIPIPFFIFWVIGF